jgi:hypothetical protein
VVDVQQALVAKEERAEERAEERGCRCLVAMLAYHVVESPHTPYVPFSMMATAVKASCTGKLLVESHAKRGSAKTQCRGGLRP